MQVKSPVMGTMSMYHADEGAEISEGSAIGEVESMKTLFRLVAPTSGMVHWRYALGEVVAEGDVVADILEKKK